MTDAYTYTYTWVQIRKILWYPGFKFMVKSNQIGVFARKFCDFFKFMVNPLGIYSI